MRQIVIACVGIFLVAWGLGLFFSYLAGLKKIKLPASPQSELSGPALLEDQRRIAAESEDLRRKAMQDQQYQIQKSRDILKINTTTNRF